MRISWRALTGAATLIILAGQASRTGAAGARLFAYSRHMAMVCEVDPISGAEIASFPVSRGDHAGLAFDGVQLFFTNDQLAVIQV